MSDRTINLSAAEDTAEAPAFPGRKEAGQIFQVTGSWTGTITFEATVDDSNWVSIQAVDVSDGSVSTTTTGNGIFRIVADGLTVRARMSSYTGGTAVVTPRTVRSS